jgi:hypothetical protein
MLAKGLMYDVDALLGTLLQSSASITSPKWVLSGLVVSACCVQHDKACVKSPCSTFSSRKHYLLFFLMQMRCDDSCVVPMNATLQRKHLQSSIEVAAKPGYSQGQQSNGSWRLFSHACNIGRLAGFAALLSTLRQLQWKWAELAR